MLDSKPTRRIWFDEAACLIREEVGGLWTIEDVKPHLEEEARFAADMRSKYGIVRALIDARRLMPQTSAVAAALEQHSVDTWAAKDLVAFVVDSTLVKLQLGRLSIRENQRAFLDDEEAKAWLSARR